MAVKDYYIVLGVARDASAESIRRAYRDLAKRFHPDRAGESGTAAFREIAEAYEVLSDPELRRDHNRSLEEDRSEGRRFPPVSPPEPLERRPTSRGNEPGVGIPWAGRPAQLELALTLTPREAGRGGVLPVGVPVYRTCIGCRGRILRRLYCLECGGSGLQRSVEPVWVQFPAGVASGSILDVTATSGGIPVRLRIRFFRCQDDLVVEVT